METSKRILITGASGLVGSRLTQMLLQKGYEVWHLSRSKEGKVPTFQWDVNRQTINEKAFEGVEAIIHLAGASVADKRWTAKRKQEILESRVKSTQLLFKELGSRNHSVKHFISASAVGYYGFENEGKIFGENDAAGNDFLAQVTKQWEHEVEKIASLGIRVARMRIGVVLARGGGALAPIAKTVKYNIGSPLGSGKQYISWVHLDDVCGIFIHTLESPSLSGPVNTVAPGPVTNKELTRAIADHLGKPMFLPAVPEFVLKIVLGEMADIVTRGSKVSPEKIMRSGYRFKFDNLDAALTDLLNEDQ
jgi:uncharacterized protein